MSHEPSEYPMRGAMRAKECAKFLGIGESTFWRWVASGLVPKGIRLSPRCTVWPVEELRTMVKRPQSAVQNKREGRDAKMPAVFSEGGDQDA